VRRNRSLATRFE